jgi:S-DNA-T family DNA segregation ATPase FtsK/SpoIIIE
MANSSPSSSASKSNKANDDFSEAAPGMERKRRSRKTGGEAASPWQKFLNFRRDERVRKSLGLVMLLFAVFLLVAFSSYFYNYQTDHDKVHGRGFGMVFDSGTSVDNALGRLGAWTGNQLIYRRFGVSAYLLVLLVGAWGVNLLYGKTYFALRRMLVYSCLAVLWLSTALTFTLGGVSDLPGGGVGRFSSDWLEGAVGSVGTALLLFFALLIFSVVFLNAELKLPMQRLLALIRGGSGLAGSLAASLTGRAASPSQTVTADDDEDSPVRQAPVYRSVEEAESFTVGSAAVEQAGEGMLEELTDAELEEEEEELAEDLDDEAIGEDEEGSGLTLEIEQPEFSDSADAEEEVEESDAEFPDLDIAEPVHEPTAAERGSLETAYNPRLELPHYQYPTLELLQDYGSSDARINNPELERNKDQIIETLNNYGISISKIKATIGPTVTLYEIVPAKGVRISKIKNLEDDIALNLAALGIRIIAPIPGKGTIGIEVPNADKTIVGMRTQLGSEKFVHSKMDLPICLGKTISGENYIADLARMPHLLLAGATGQGKSVGINAILVSLLYKKHPTELKFVLVDPKKVELSLFQRIENHFLAKMPGEEESIVTDTRKVVNTLNALCIEMDGRYDLLKKAQTRNITEYNQKFQKRKLNPQNGHRFLPFIVLIIDEFADLIMTAGKEVEMPLARLAQLARAVGIHLVIATQRPSVNIITGLIKANFPARIAFKVTAKVDSRTILDTGGADQLIGRGDMLLSIGSDIIRLQCPFVDTPEVEEVADFIGQQQAPAEPFYLPEYLDEKEAMAGEDFDGERDSMFPEAARLVVQHQQGSTSLIQRKMKLGYNRAGRLMDQLEAAGIVGPNLGSKAREVLIRDTAELERFLESVE